ncbi:MAG TPA: ABC transporter substrate-binding protein [Candidatus Binatia bacterium]|jgi:ABC-type nitrate/sulfonate/bicarbonate transport system substrate-binding protein
MKIVFVLWAAFSILSLQSLAFANHRSTIRVAYPSLGLPQAPLWIANEANYFGEAGLRVETLFIQNSSTVIQSLLSDEIDYAMVGAAPVVAVDLRGADVVMIATTIPTLIFYLIARPEIHKIDDLKGKAIGIGRFGSNTDFAARLLLEKHRLLPGKDVALIQTAGGTATNIAIKTGKVQAGVTTDVGMLEGKKLGLRELFAFKDLGIPFAHQGFAAKRSFLKNHENETLNFLHAIAKGIYRMIADRTFSARVVQKVARIEDRTIVDASLDLHTNQFVQKKFYTTPAMIQTVLRQVAETVPAAQNANAADFIDNRFVQILEQRGVYTDLERTFKQK